VTSFFFTFLKVFLNGQGGPFVCVGFVLVAGFVLDSRRFAFCSEEKGSLLGRIPGREISRIRYYIISTPFILNPVRERPYFRPWLIICAPGRIA
jgi:hypothetical protein